MDYYTRTYNHPSRIKRFAHQSRVAMAITLMKGLGNDSKILDFGCGRGYFICELLKSYQCHAIGYDKFMQTKDERIFNQFSEVSNVGYYDFFTCFETLEHCHPSEQKRILNVAYEQLNNNGKMIISVPIEIGPISLLKNFMRRNTKDASFPDFTFTNIIKAAFYQPTTWHRDTLNYPGHFGWDHRRLEKLINDANQFKIIKKGYSPLQLLPSIWINSQVFYVLEKVQ